MDPAKILLIDSNREDRDTVSVFLSGEGYIVHCADNGYDGLEKAKSDKFDLIILELNLPDIKGKEVCTRLKHGRNKRNTPILILSARDEIDEIEELFQRGVDDYIVKPPRLSNLISRVEFNIANKRAKK